MIVKDNGILLISIHYLLLGAYEIVYAKILLTAANMVSCFAMDCLILSFLRMLSWVLGVIGVCYILIAVLIRFHRVGCYMALAASCFNIVLMITYLIKPTMLPIWFTFILPVRVILTKSLSYSPEQARDFLSLFENSLEVFIILLNIVIAAYLLRCLGRGVWKERKAKAKKVNEKN